MSRVTGWYVSRNGFQQGPLSSTEVKRRAKSGELLPTDLIRRAGTEDWALASRVKGLFDQSADSGTDLRTPHDSPDSRADAPLPRIATAADWWKRRDTRPTGLIESIFDSIRRSVPERAIDGISNGFVLWGGRAALVAALLCSALLVLRSVKNDDTRLLAWAAAVMIAVGALRYIALRIIPTLMSLLKGTPSQLSSTAFADSFALTILLVGAIVIGLIVSFSTPLEPWSESIGMIIVAVEIAGWTLFIACVSLNYRSLNIVIDAQTSLGEEAVGILSFFTKLIIRTVPISFGVATITAAILLAVEFFLLVSGDREQILRGETFESAAVYHAFGALLSPPFAYIICCFSYLVVDIVRAWLAIPRQLMSIASRLPPTVL